MLFSVLRGDRKNTPRNNQQCFMVIKQTHNLSANTIVSRTSSTTTETRNFLGAKNNRAKIKTLNFLFQKVEKR